MGCTIVLDYRYGFPSTIIEISKDGDSFVCQADNADLDESGNLVWIPNTQAEKTVVTLRKNGAWVMRGHKFANTHVVLGIRDPKLKK